MGVALWLLCGVAVFALSRAIALGRPPGFFVELVLALAASFCAGLAASALDFGGWSELDWRAGAFVVFVCLATIGVARSVRLSARNVAGS